MDLYAELRKQFPGASESFLASAKELIDKEQGNTPEKSATKPTPASKYRNVRAEAEGLSFQSGHEAEVVWGLIKAEEAKQIFGLRLQVRFPLTDAKNRSDAVYYVADAVYMEIQNGKLTPVVADAKGKRLRDYINKSKIFKERYGIQITEL